MGRLCLYFSLSLRFPRLWLSALSSLQAERQRSEGAVTSKGRRYGIQDPHNSDLPAQAADEKRIDSQTKRRSVELSLPFSSNSINPADLL